MRLDGRRWTALASTLVLAGALAGCAGARIVDGVFHSPKGYRVTVPSGDWTVTMRGRADLDIRHATEPVGMVVNASCEGYPRRADLDVLARHLLVGLRDRSDISVEEMSVNGKIARHAVIEGRLGTGGRPVRIETYVVRGEACVYDLLYAAPPASFAEWRAVFHHVVETFRTE
jgi:hypothetical protein